MDNASNKPDQEVGKSVRKSSFGMEELGACLDDPDAPDQLHLKESDMNEKVRLLEKYLTFWLPEQVKLSTDSGSSNRAA